MRLLTPKLLVKRSEIVPALTILLGCLVAMVAPDALALSALEPWDAEARDALPTPIKVWLGLMMLTNLIAIAFLKNHVAARWVFAGFVLSHGIVVTMWANDIQVLAGQVSALHIVFWTPGAIALLSRRAEIRATKPYGAWAIASLLFYCGSMLVDCRDTAIYLGHLLN